ncbi:DUF1576 domain-containing protein [uncultured Intestinimonas sp.]|uniref:DUF1576 domain-containing protein n=1 Tax=uncultured Intestinimonas sp. TaxID=1689265 RepID=UPI0025D60904|nr:DUF1576 domain-containing protein [uncultured Intestinimonas sp.]
MRYKNMYFAILGYALALILAGLIFDDPANIIPGLWKIINTQDVLITDYVAIAGPGAAFVNSALVTLISAAILFLSRCPLNGFTITEMGLMSGFALFGKNITNIWPIFLGTWIYARIQKEPFSKYTSVALLATALSPLVSYMAYGSLYSHPLGGLLIGVLIGMVLPPLSAYTYKVQNGMNLYNMGFACGLLAMMLVPILTAVGDAPSSVLYWAEGYNLRFGAAMALMCLVFIVCGLFFSDRPVWASWAGYRRILTSTGRAPSDFLRMVGTGPVLINMGVNGLLATGYILLVGGDLNGPTLGGILTIIGFSAYGKHAKNILPIMCGVLLGGIFMHYTVEAPALQLAALFGTTLAPFAGVFGWPAGILAGFLHSAVVLQAGYVLAGVNLYNNGFSGGLIAIVLFPLITAIFRHRKPELTPRSLFDVFEEDKPALMERDLPPEERTPEGKPFPVIQEKQEEKKSDQE